LTPFGERLQDVRKRIDEAARRSGRDASSVTLVAVTKTHPVETIQTAYQQGLREFGENRVQEALVKIDALPSDIRWHLIGQLQTNKINKIRGRFRLIHSVDSVDLGSDMSSRLSTAPQEILLEVNTSGEASKSGVDPMNAIKSVHELSVLPNLKLRGLMTVGPLTEDPQRQREAFRVLRGLFDRIRSEGWAETGFDVLSMGMSSDFEIAVEEGSTLVRVGTALFGRRDSSPTL
jgi:pyridoxal phosphate enzyme (YggS family)